MNNPKEQIVFSKVDTRSERQRAYSLLIESKEHIQIQFENKTVVKFLPRSIQDAQIQVVPTTDINTKSIQNVIVTFSIGKERYFLRTLLRQDAREDFFIEINQDLFKLQRRSSFRIRIPNSYKAKVEIQSLNGHPSIGKFPLTDLSAGGFSFELGPESKFEITKGNTFVAKISVIGKFERKAEGEIRYVGSIGSRSSGIRKVGAQFRNLSTADHEAFLKITWDIHRELFSTLKMGS